MDLIDIELRSSFAAKNIVLSISKCAYDNDYYRSRDTIISNNLVRIEYL